MMNSNEMRRRVDNLERSLNPRQAIILAMERALARFDSLTDCAAWLADHPDERLLGDPREVLSDFDKRLKKERPLALIKSIGNELAERATLASLWINSNGYVGEVTERELLRLALIAQRNSQVMDQIGVQRTVPVVLKVVGAQPYPLDCEDAAAIEAATAHQVQTWETFLTCDVPDWLAKDKSTDRTNAGVDAFEDAVRALIKAGEVKAAAAVELGSVPLESLLLAPLLDGEWIDRHVVELAEFGAMIEASGFTSRVNADPHYLAPLWICQAGEGEQHVAADEKVIAQLRGEAKAALAEFSGRSMDIDGRPCLHIDDYRAWAGRKLQGDLQVVEGPVVPSWNRWVDRQGGEGRAELAGTKVHHLVPLADRRDFITCPDPEELIRWRRRRVLDLAKIHALLARHTGPTDWSYGEDIERLLQDLLEADSTISAISDRSFGGHQVLFNELQGKLREQIAEARGLSNSYNRLLDRGWPVDQTGDGLGARRLKIDVDQIRCAAEASSKHVLDSLIEQAKAQPPTAIESSNSAKRMLNPMLKQLKDHYR